MTGVIQSDRDAAAKVIGGWWRNLKEDVVASYMRDGMLDDNPLVQAFKDHRLFHTRGAPPSPRPRPLGCVAGTASGTAMCSAARTPDCIYPLCDTPKDS